MELKVNIKVPRIMVLGVMGSSFCFSSLLYINLLKGDITANTILVLGCVVWGFLIAIGYIFDITSIYNSMPW